MSRRRGRQRLLVEIAPGQFKPPPRCSPKQREAAAELLAAKGELLNDCYALLGALTRHLPAPLPAEAIPEWLSPHTLRVLHGDIGNPSVLDLELERDDLTRWLAEFENP